MIDKGHPTNIALLFFIAKRLMETLFSVLLE